jgi:GGDEF domain-containing protein
LKYAGFLSSESLLNVIHEKNLAVARDQNPLSKLPGNVLIHEYVSNVLNSRKGDHILAYFDFDNFKPYNDQYGFRHGDRMITLFAELIKKHCESDKFYAGHIGGDDFFMGIQDTDLEVAIKKVKAIQVRFKHDAESFYDPEAIRKGHIVSRDREGNEKRFPLMIISAVLLALPKNRPAVYSSEAVSNIIAGLKSSVKNSPDKFCMAFIDDFEKKPSNVRRIISQGDVLKRLSA